MTFQHLIKLTHTRAIDKYVLTGLLAMTYIDRPKHILTKHTVNHGIQTVDLNQGTQQTSSKTGTHTRRQTEAQLYLLGLWLRWLLLLLLLL